MGLSRKAFGRALEGTAESIVWRWENAVHRPSKAMQRLIEIILEAHRARKIAALAAGSVSESDTRVLLALTELPVGPKEIA